MALIKCTENFILPEKDGKWQQVWKFEANSASFSILPTFCDLKIIFFKNSSVKELV